MVNIPEGTVKQHPNGGTYMRQGGVWVLQGSAPATAAPSNGVLGVIEGPKPAPKVQQVGSSLGVVGEDGSFTPTYTAPEKPEKPDRPQFVPQGATQMMLPDGTIAPVPGATGTSALPPGKAAELRGQQAAIGDFERAINDLEGIYKQKLAGDKGSVLGMGGDRNLGGYLPAIINPDNKTFNDTADSLIGFIAKAQGATGGEMNSLAEMRARFGPLIPIASDTDENIQRKLAALRAMAEGQKRQIASQMGAEVPAPAAETNTTPSGERIYEGGAPQGVELSNGGTQTVDDPLLAGVNAKVNGMLKAGASGTQIATFLKENGIPASAVNLQQVLRFRRENPNYKGDYTVNIDDKEVPMSGFRSRIADAANSPIAAGVVAAADTLTGGHIDNIAGAAGGNAELANMGVGMLRDANPKASFAGDLAGGAMLYGVGGGAMNAIGRGAPAATGAFAGRAVAGDAAMGAYVGSGQGGTQVFSPGNALAGAVSGAAGGVLGRGAINAAGRALSPTGGALAPAYAEGVQPTIGQRMGGVVGRAEEAFASVPLVGGIQRSARNGAIQQWQAGAFNRALREVGAELPKGVQSGVQAQAFMQRTFNKVYDQARSGLTFRQDAQFNSEFSTLVKDEVAALGSDGQRIFKTFVDRGSNMLKARGGTLAGQDYKNLVSRIEAKVRGLRKSPSGDTELADALEGLSMTLDKAARRHSTPEAVQALDAADRGYVMAVLIEEAGRKAGTDMGEFTGKQLESAIRSNSGRRSRQALRGEAPLQDYAAAGVELGNSVPDSGTAERIATMGGMGAAAHFIDPTMLLPWAANTMMNIPGGKQAMNLLMAPNRKGLDPARQRLMERANLGGLLAAPAAQVATGQ